MAVCEAICEPSAVTGIDTGACPMGQGCVPLLLTDDDGGLEEVLDFGTCVDACEPWVDVSESGCAQDTWCVPTSFNTSTGECSGFIGLATEFMACDEASIGSTCMAGLLCMGAQYNTPLSGTCKRLCNMQGETNCTNGMICEELAFMSNEGEAFPLGVGTCTFP